MEQTVVNIEGEAVAAEPQKFRSTGYCEIQFVTQVLGSIGHTAAEQNGEEGLVKA